MYKNTNSDHQAVNDNWHLTVPMLMKIRFKIKSRRRKWNGNEANFIMARDKIVIILVPWQINTCHCFIYFIKFMLFCQCQAHVDLVCYYLQNTNYSSRCQQKLSPSLECSTPPPPPHPLGCVPRPVSMFRLKFGAGSVGLALLEGCVLLASNHCAQPVCTSRSNVNVNTDLARTTTNYLSMYLPSITGWKRKCKNMSWWHIKARVVYNKCFGWDHRWPHSDRVRKTWSITES